MEDEDEVYEKINSEFEEYQIKELEKRDKIYKLHFKRTKKMYVADRIVTYVISGIALILVFLSIALIADKGSIKVIQGDNGVFDNTSSFSYMDSNPGWSSVYILMSILFPIINIGNFMIKKDFREESNITKASIIINVLYVLFNIISMINFLENSSGAKLAEHLMNDKSTSIVVTEISNAIKIYGFILYALLIGSIHNLIVAIIRKNLAWKY